MHNVTIPDPAVAYILFQRTGYLTFTRHPLYRTFKKIVPFSLYNQLVHKEARKRSGTIKSLYTADMEKEYLSIQNALPPSLDSILDIGCGVAGVDVFLARHYASQCPEFYLLDKTHIENRVFYGFKPAGSFYNSLQVAKDLLAANQIDPSRVHTIEATPQNEIPVDTNVDLIISLISWGYHYPVQTYLENAYNLLAEKGTLIIDVRKNTPGLEQLKNKFKNLEIIIDHKKYVRVLAQK